MKRRGTTGGEMVRKNIQMLVRHKNMYSYIWHRMLVKARSLMGFAPLYPYEDSYRFDAGVENILAQIREAVAPADRGDNPAFNKNWTDVYERESKARDISACIRKIAGGWPADIETSNAREIRDVGYTRFDRKKLSPANVDEMVRYFDRQKVYAAHVAHFALKPAQTREQVKQTSAFGSYDLETILQAPYVARMLSDRDVIGNIADYFGCLPTISSVNVFWSFASEDGKPRGPQNFHRDVDDVRTCTMFMNLTDTMPNEGAHCYIRRTHTIDQLKSIFDDRKNDTLPEAMNPWGRRIRPEDFFSLPLNGYSFEQLYEHFFADQFDYIYGERGSVVTTDNYGIHRGVPVRVSDRLILWVSFALTATHAQSAKVKLLKRVDYADVRGQIEDTPVNRYVLRNIVKFS